MGRRVIYDVHENLPDQLLSKDWLPRAIRGAVARIMDVIERVSARLFDAVVVATPDIARRFPAHKTVIVQNFPLLSEFRCCENLPPTAIRRDLVYIGGIAEIRGIVEMVEAMAILKREKPGMCLNVAGRFSSVQLEEVVRAMEGASAVRFLGWQSRDEVSNLLSSALAGVVVLRPTPSYQRAYPVKLFEYMAAGIPVIASDFPLWREIVEEAQCGLLVDPQDPRAIADAAIWLAEHQSEARTMGAAGAAAVRSRFNWPHEAQKLLSLYVRLGSPAKPHRPIRPH
jgi:glycosyltransferase involved in cell wall biosynthesis